MGTWASVDPELLELSDDGRTVTRLAPRNLHEHACALGGTVLREGCHRWDVELDHVWEDQGGINLCVGVKQLSRRFPALCFWLVFRVNLGII